MKQSEFREQVAASAKTTLEELRKDPTSTNGLFFAALFTEMGARDRELEEAAARFRAWRAGEGEEKTRQVLREGAAYGFLVNTWNGLGHAHYYGCELGVLAEWLIALTTEASELGGLPYAIGNWCGSWQEVGMNAVKACDRIAAAALARDPENESALWLYAQGDFLRRVKRKGPPIPEPSLAARIAKIESIVRLYEEDVVHPLDIPSLDTIPVTSKPIVDALLHALATTKSWRARRRLIEALGRARVDYDRIIEAFIRELENPDTTDDVSMAIHYELGANGVGAIDALMNTSRRFVDELSEKDTSDYRHRWPLTAFVTLLPHTRREARDRACAFAERLLAECEQMPVWKRGRFYDFVHEAPPALRKLLRQSVARI